MMWPPLCGTCLHKMDLLLTFVISHSLCLPVVMTQALYVSYLSRQSLTLLKWKKMIMALFFFFVFGCPLAYGVPRLGVRSEPQLRPIPHVWGGDRAWDLVLQRHCWSPCAAVGTPDHGSSWSFFSPSTWFFFLSKLSNFMRNLLGFLKELSLFSDYFGDNCRC